MSSWLRNLQRRAHIRKHGTGQSRDPFKVRADATPKPDWRASGFDPRVNRWTSKPHKNLREIERRARQRASGEAQ